MGLAKTLKGISQLGDFAFFHREDEYFLIMYTHTLESEELFQSTPGESLTPDPHGMGEPKGIPQGNTEEMSSAPTQ